MVGDHAITMRQQTHVVVDGDHTTTLKEWGIGADYKTIAESLQQVTILLVFLSK